MNDSRRNGLTLSGLVIMIGCVGLPPPPPGAGESTESSPSSGSLQASDIGTTDADTGALDDTTTIESDPDTGSTAPPPTAVSCAEILELDPSAATGRHEIVRARDGEVFEVYCEMDLDDGGWTLVARSEEGDQEPFGWGQPHGSLDEEGVPYSLDVAELGLSFGEILVATRTGFATPVANTYVLEVPPDFVEAYTDQAYEHPGARTVLGVCQPTPQQTLLRWVGHTNNVASYFFRDLEMDDAWGLHSDGFHMVYDDCSRGAELNGEQGALFVR